MAKDIIKEYYKDQIVFYTNRLNKIKKGIADKERVGLPITELDNLQVEIETEHILEFENRLKGRKDNE